MDEQTDGFDLGKSRIEALADGIFAIAMTLLVLGLRPPDLPPNSPNVRVAPALLKLLPDLLSYAVSFVSLGIFWVGHHNMYHAVRRTDRFLLWLNLVFFLFVALLPFTTSLLHAFPMTQVAPLCFGANLTAIGWILFLQWAYAGRQGNMLAPHITRSYREMVQFRFLAVPAVLTLTMLICFWSIQISLAIYLLLLPLYLIPGNVGVCAGGETTRARRI